MLEKNQIKADSYQQELESLLLRLRREIEHTDRPGSKNPAPKDWEHQLYEINAFYYRSFHERFFPLYKNSIKQEVAALLKISSQEDMIITDLMAGLKRSARLFNQLKRLMSLLRQYQAENQQQLPELGRNIDRNKLELFYSCRSLQASLNDMEEAARDFKLLAAEKELLASMDRANLPYELPAFIAGLDRNNPLLLEHWQQVSSCLQAWQSSLLKLPSSQENHLMGAQITSRSLEELGRILDKCGSSWDFFRKQIYHNLVFRAELLCMCLQTGNYSKAEHLAKEFALYLQDLLTVMDKSSSLKMQSISRLLPAASRIAKLNPAYPDRLLDMVSAAGQKLKQLLDSHPQAGGIDLTWFSSQVEDILDTASPLCQAAGGIEESSLETLSTRIELEFSFLRARIELLQENNLHSSALFSRLIAIDKMLDANLEHLADIKSDLERLLAPRNLSRFWKDRLVRVDRIALEKGQLFPSEYLHLLDKHRVETRISEQADNIILDEQGDIFVIRVDELLEEELPYFVVSKAGT